MRMKDNNDNEQEEDSNEQEQDDDDFVTYLLGDDDACRWGWWKRQTFVPLSYGIHPWTTTNNKTSTAKQLQEYYHRQAQLLHPPRERHSMYEIDWSGIILSKNWQRKDQSNAFLQMEHSLLLTLCQIIEPFVHVNDKILQRWSKGKNPISVEVILHCTSRWLGGGSYLVIRLSTGISVAASSFTEVFMLESMPLYCVNPLRLPSLPQKCIDIQTAQNGVIDGCVACVNGILLKQQPKWET